MAVTDEWRDRHRLGMEAAKAKTAMRRLPGPVMAERKRQMREKHPCKVKGCKCTAYKGAICKGHWDMIPQREKVEATIAVFDAQLKATARYHRRFLRELNAGVHGATS